MTAKPYALSTVKVAATKTPAEIKKAQGWAGRHGYHWPKGTVLPETIARPTILTHDSEGKPAELQAGQRVKIADLPVGFIPPRLYERNLEQNQMIASCCRHPENHEIEAFKSHPEEPAPDIYIFHCTGCGRKHRVFCVGHTDESRPLWCAS